MKMMLMSLSYWVMILCLIGVPVYADTPANCTYEDIRGEWIFSLGPGNRNNKIDCSSFKVKRTTKVFLDFPDTATDEFNNVGFWTLIYNQGFEVVVGGRKYFAFSKYVNETSYCSKTMKGTTHDLLSRDWACYKGKKTVSVPPKVSRKIERPSLFKQRLYSRIDSDLQVWRINAVQSSWKAVKYNQWSGLSNDDFVALAGGRRSMFSRPRAMPLTEEQKAIRDALPEQFDWRHFHGQNFVSPVRAQGMCGSCYAFASMAISEARVRILTNNTQTPVFSPQDVVDCSSYSQGCDGGFPYLIAGKYAEDYGLVEEKYNPYVGQAGSCKTSSKAPRHYATNYRYVGGFYGGCNEALMLQAIYKNGPIAVSFEVYDDFQNYKSGIYHHTTNLGVDKFNPFDITNHVVLIVGWGVDKKTNEKYWIVKNSWGTEWGIDGYFWIRRGNDECGIESIAMEAFPMLTFNN